MPVSAGVENEQPSMDGNVLSVAVVTVQIQNAVRERSSVDYHTPEAFHQTSTIAVAQKLAVYNFD